MSENHTEAITVSLTERQLFEALSSIEQQGKKISNEEYYQAVNTLLPEDLHFEYDRKTYTSLDAVIKKYKRSKKTQKFFIENAGSEVLLCLDLPHSNLNHVVLNEQPEPPVKKRRQSEEYTTKFTQSYKDFNDLERR